MQAMQHQMMGYDRAITMFSPDGRLLQVEYAKKTVRQGSAAIGMVCKDGIILVSDKRIMDKLVVPSSIEKIWKIDDHIGVTGAGIISDARVLIERAQLKAQQHRVTYDSPIDVLSVVKDVADVKQFFTQSGGLRPFGVSLLIAGIDEHGKRVFETDPTGIYFEYKATAIGEGENKIKEILEKEYKESLSVEDGIRLSVNALKKVHDHQFSPDRVEVAVIKESDKQFMKMPKEALLKILSKK